MCGIVGYVGPKKVVPVIIEGLRRLEYRGYDSAGIAVGSPSSAILEVRRAPGKLANLEEVLREHPLDGTFGIGHTRWATHGRPTEENAPTATAPAASLSSTTASLKITSTSSANSPL